MPILTAAPSAPSDVPHHLLGMLDVYDTYDAARFLTDADHVIEGIRVRGHTPWMVGGTALYLRCWLKGFGPGVPRDEAYREALKARVAREGREALHAELARADPERAAALHANDTRRLVRALEIWELTGQPPSRFRGQFGGVRADLERVVFVVERERRDMDARIDARVERMIAAGWVEECRRLRADPRGISPEAAQAIGYCELLEWLEAGEPEPLSEVVTRVQTATRRFARRQLTWLRRLEGTVQRLQVGAGEEPLIHLERVLESL